MKVSAQQLVAWLERETEQRRRIYAQRVDEGRMPKAEADHHLNVLSAMLADHIAWSAPGGAPETGWGDAVPWSHKCEWLEREIEQRRRVYERRIDEGRMTTEAADRELIVLDSLQIHYRDWLFTMPGGLDAARDELARREADAAPAPTLF